MNNFKHNFLLVVATVILMSACSDPKTVDNFHASATIAVSETPLSTPLYVADKQGFFKKYGMDVKLERYQGGHKCLKAVLDGKADYGTSSDYPVMMNSFKRDDFAILATFVSSDNDVKMMANTGAGIATQEDLKGKRVGVVTGGSSHYFLDRFLLFNGMTLEDVSIQHISPQDMPTAIESGNVDAIAVWEPFGYLSKKQLGDNLLIFEAKDYYRETFNFVALKKTTNKNEEITKRLVMALKDAEMFIKQSPEQAQKIVIDELTLDQEFIDWIWNDFNFSLSLDQSLILTLENEAKWAIENNVVDAHSAPNYLGFIDTRFLQSVNSSQVNIVN